MNHKSLRKASLSFPNFFYYLISTKNIDWLYRMDLRVTHKAHSMSWIHSLSPIAITDPGITFYFLIHLSLPELIHSFTDSQIITTQSISCSDIKLRTKAWTQSRSVRGPVNVAWIDSITFHNKALFLHTGVNQHTYFLSVPSLRSVPTCSFSTWFVIILKLVINRNSAMILAHNRQKRHLPSSTALQPQRVNNWILINEEMDLANVARILSRKLI